MNAYHKHLKKRLLRIIREMACNVKTFVQRPGRDFTRKRHLSFVTMMRLLITLGSGTVYKELLDGLKPNAYLPTVSAFVQQREKILPEAVQHLFHKFTDSIPCRKTFRDYRLIAGDSTDLITPLNKHCAYSYHRGKPGSNGYNSIHLSALYDLCNKCYLDALPQPLKHKDERRAIVNMINRSYITDNAIFLGDRNFEGYNVFANIERKGWHYLIRIKDVAGIMKTQPIPDSLEFDIPVNRILSRKHINKRIDPMGIHRNLTPRTTFDFLPPGSPDSYPISFRIVRVLLDNGTIETLATNLPADSFTPSVLKVLYNKRWGIETSFRKLKHTIGLAAFHSLKIGCIVQEIFARLLLYNFVEAVISSVTPPPSQSNKYAYQVNFTNAVILCRSFLRPRSNAPPDIISLISGCLLPIKPNRIARRLVKCQTFVSFNYRLV
jgi:hypothetical protein